MKSVRDYISRHFTTAAVIAALLSNALVSNSQPLSCGITQVTFSTTGGHNYPTISNDGNLVAFSSNTDPIGENPDHNLEVFLYDSLTGETDQLTESVAVHNFSPYISGDGTKIAFHSTGNPLGGNPDGSSEIFLLDLTTSELSQLTFGTIGNTIESIDDTGSAISFYSWDNYTGNNADNTIEIFVYKVPTNQFIQVTTSNSGGFAHGGSDLSGDGLMLAFGSHLNLAGVDPDGKYDVFVYDIAAGELSQISPVGEQAIAGTWSADGSRYVFYSDGYAVGFGAPNPDKSFELFLYNSSNGSVQMLTDTAAGVYNSQATISSDGNRIAFISTNDWTGGNADNLPDVFLMDLSTGAITQVTDTDNYEILYPRISGDGSKIVFISNQFAHLGNADASYEIFLAECLPPPSADLSISLGANKTKAKPGEQVTYTITVQNNGPSGSSNIVVNDLIPTGSTFLSAQSNKGSFNAPPVGQSGVVTWNVGSLSNNSQSTAQIAVTVILKGKGTVTNTATVSSSTSDPNTANNTASIAVSIGTGAKK